jgi:hypothetical protein
MEAGLPRPSWEGAGWSDAWQGLEGEACGKVWQAIAGLHFRVAIHDALPSASSASPQPATEWLAAAAPLRRALAAAGGARLPVGTALVAAGALEALRCDALASAQVHQSSWEGSSGGPAAAVLQPGRQLLAELRQEVKPWLAASRARQALSSSSSAGRDAAPDEPSSAAASRGAAARPRPRLFRDRVGAGPDWAPDVRALSARLAEAPPASAAAALELAAQLMAAAEAVWEGPDAPWEGRFLDQGPAVPAGGGAAAGEAQAVHQAAERQQRQKQQEQEQEQQQHQEQQQEQQQPQQQQQQRRQRRRQQQQQQQEQTAKGAPSAAAPSTAAVSPPPFAAAAAAPPARRAPRSCAVCSRTRRDGAELRRCAGCGLVTGVRYCGQACCRRHWEELGHRAACEAAREENRRLHEAAAAAAEKVGG